MNFWDKLHEQKVTAEVNQRYHQLLARRWERWDRAAKIAVAILGTVALLSSFLPAHHAWAGVALGAAGVVAAVALNVVPLGDWRCAHGEMFRSWGELVQSAEQLEFRARKLGEDATVPGPLFERLEEVASRSYQLDATESAPDAALLELN